MGASIPDWVSLRSLWEGCESVFELKELVCFVCLLHLVTDVEQQPVGSVALR